MQTAVSIIYNGHYFGGVFGTAEQALRHVAKSHLQQFYGGDIDLDGEIAGWQSTYSVTSSADEAPSLAHMVALELADDAQESLELTVHNLDAEPGLDTSLVTFDVMDPMDPNFALVAALENVRSGDLDADEAARRLEEKVAQIVDSFGVRYQDLLRLQHHFGCPVGSRRNLLPDGPDQPSDAKAFLEQLPALAVERFQELLPLYAPGQEPTL